MGWEPIAYRCGHQGREQMYGKTSLREQRAAYLGQGLCPDCLAEERAAAADAGRVAAQTIGLRALEGSPKQIAWAEQVRGALVAEYTGCKSVGVASLILDPVTPHLAMPRAAWWIDNRQMVARMTATLRDARARVEWETAHGETSVVHADYVATVEG